MVTNPVSYKEKLPSSYERSYPLMTEEGRTDLATEIVKSAQRDHHIKRTKFIDVLKLNKEFFGGDASFEKMLSKLKLGGLGTIVSKKKEAEQISQVKRRLEEMANKNSEMTDEFINNAHLNEAVDEKIREVTSKHLSKLSEAADVRVKMANALAPLLSGVLKLPAPIPIHKMELLKIVNVKEDEVTAQGLEAKIKEKLGKTDESLYRALAYLNVNFGEEEVNGEKVKDTLSKIETNPEFDNKIFREIRNDLVGHHTINYAMDPLVKSLDSLNKLHTFQNQLAQLSTNLTIYRNGSLLPQLLQTVKFNLSKLEIPVESNINTPADDLGSIAAFVTSAEQWIKTQENLLNTTSIHLNNITPYLNEFKRLREDHYLSREKIKQLEQFGMSVLSLSKGMNNTVSNLKTDERAILNNNQLFISFRDGLKQTENNLQSKEKPAKEFERWFPQPYYARADLTSLINATDATSRFIYPNLKNPTILPQEELDLITSPTSLANNWPENLIQPELKKFDSFVGKIKEAQKDIRDEQGLKDALNALSGATKEFANMNFITQSRLLEFRQLQMNAVTDKITTFLETESGRNRIINELAREWNFGVDAFSDEDFKILTDPLIYQEMRKLFSQHKIELEEKDITNIIGLMTQNKLQTLFTNVLTNTKLKSKDQEKIITALSALNTKEMAQKNALTNAVESMLSNVNAEKIETFITDVSNYLEPTLTEVITNKVLDNGCDKWMDGLTANLSLHDIMKVNFFTNKDYRRKMISSLKQGKIDLKNPTAVREAITAIITADDSLSAPFLVSLKPKIDETVTDLKGKLVNPANDQIAGITTKLRSVTKFVTKLSQLGFNVKSWSKQLDELETKLNFHSNKLKKDDKLPLQQQAFLDEFTEKIQLTKISQLLVDNKVPALTTEIDGLLQAHNVKIDGGELKFKDDTVAKPENNPLLKSFINKKEGKEVNWPKTIDKLVTTINQKVIELIVAKKTDLILANAAGVYGIGGTPKVFMDKLKELNTHAKKEMQKVLSKNKLSEVTTLATTYEKRATAMIGDYYIYKLFDKVTINLSLSNEQINTFKKEKGELSGINTIGLGLAAKKDLGETVPAAENQALDGKILQVNAAIVTKIISEINKTGVANVDAVEGKLFTKLDEPTPNIVAAQSATALKKSILTNTTQRNTKLLLDKLPTLKTLPEALVPQVKQQILALQEKINESDVVTISTGGVPIAPSHLQKLYPKMALALDKITNDETLQTFKTEMQAILAKFKKTP